MPPRSSRPDIQAEIRVATPADAPDIARVLREAFAEFEPLYTERGFAATTPHEAVVRKRMNEGPAWVALFRNEIVGTVSAVIQHENSLYIRSMAIVPGARGHGTSKLLLRKVEETARQLKCRRLYLSTTPFLKSAIHVYESVGYGRVK